ncbi:YlbF family regulator [Eubacteriaceae bacterium ES3]|nr:YlbF family regulator [Eubacteriaceae bacterium ES3]
MNIFDAANDFAAALKETESYLDFIKAKEALMADQEKYAMAKDYMEKQMAIQSLQMSGEELTQEQVDEYNNLADMIMTIPLIAAYFEAQVKFSIYYQEIADQIVQSVELQLD